MPPSSLVQRLNMIKLFQIIKTKPELRECHNEYQKYESMIPGNPLIKMVQDCWCSPVSTNGDCGNVFSSQRTTGRKEKACFFLICQMSFRNRIPPKPPSQTHKSMHHYFTFSSSADHGCQAYHPPFASDHSAKMKNRD